MKRLLLLLSLLLLPLQVQAQLRYQGETSLYQDTVWDGEVLIDGILTVAMGVTLEIRPGTVVRFTRFDSNADQIGEHELFVQGRLLARGTAERPILFTSAQATPRPGDWGALNMMMNDEESNQLDHCIVEYGYRGFHAHFSNAELRNCLFRHNQRGAQFQEATVLVDGCRFEDNFNGLQFRDSTVELRNSRIAGNQWGVRAVYVDLTLQGCRIEKNRTNGISLRDSDFVISGNRLLGNRRGIYLQRSRGRLEGNQLVGNLEHGIYLEDAIADVTANLLFDNGRAGLKIQDSGGQIYDNSIYGNHQYDIVNGGSEDIAVGANWYGGQSPTILDRGERPALGRILLAAPLTTQPVTTP